MVTDLIGLSTTHPSPTLTMMTKQRHLSLHIPFTTLLIIIIVTTTIEQFTCQAASFVTHTNCYNPTTNVKSIHNRNSSSCSSARKEIRHDNVQMKPKSIILEEFRNYVQSSVSSSTFQSFLLTSNKTRNRSKGNINSIDHKQPMIKSISGRLVHLKKRQIKCHVNTKYFGATDIAKNVDLKDIDSFLFDVLEHKSYIQIVSFSTIEGTYNLKIKGNQGYIEFQKNEIENVQVGIQEHDRSKNVPLDPSAMFLQKLGISDSDGKPRQNMKSKLRQCQRFCEIVGALIIDNPASQESKGLKVVDMGCGRGYLTFSLHSYLKEQGLFVNTCGVEMQPKLVNETNGIAHELGDPFRGSLLFVEGTIESYMTDRQNENDLVDVMIALHACDTATDDALWCAIRQNAQVIVTAPCCHKEVRRQLDPFITKTKSNHPMYDVLRYGIYRERISETVTDSLRALFLELAHYDVQVFEFIGGEHTAKNVMITAKKRKRKRSEKNLNEIRSRIHSLAALHGVKHQKLGQWMNETLTPEGVPLQQLRSSKKMPPL